ncbi:hypothetical protein, partial [Escherichia coli]|uniref:hypothetical protein n=1 Tax=Escherichia coli TaxID=562 RepID=UPI00237956ED
SGKNIIRWLLKKRTNGSVRYCQYTSAFYILMQIVSEYIALLQDDVDPKNATEERHCCWQIEEVSGFVTPEKRSPAIIAGGAVQLIIVCL